MLLETYTKYRHRGMKVEKETFNVIKMDMHYI